ncbi:MAG: alkaline phosphatase family protein [Clostridia bacterium]|nr:alkaline phosphatase family protein [Clostridia bacterium]
MQYTYQYAVIIGIDGMGNFNKDTDTPEMDRIFGSGAQTLSAISMYPTISAQNWGAMLLGANPEVHGLTNGIVSENEYTNGSLPSLFSKIRRAFPDALLCSYCNWNPINHGIIEHNADVEMRTSEDDAELCAMIEKCIEKKPKFLFIQFDEVDGAGHRYGYGTEGHLNQIKVTDGYVGRVYDAYVRAGIADDTLFTVIADHGGYLHGHGSYTDTEKYIYLAAAGKTVRKGNIPAARTKDINAIILHAFGLEVPPYDPLGYSAQVPANIFDGCGADYVDSPAGVKAPPHSPSPEITGGNGLLKFFDKEDMSLAAFFDNSLDDELGKTDLYAEGTVKYYSEGVRGSRAEIGSIGTLKADNFRFENGFAAALWIIKDTPVTSFVPVMKFSGKEKSSSLSLGMTPEGLRLILSSENGNSEEFETPLPSDTAKDKIHLIVSVNPQDESVNVYVDFTHIFSVRYITGYSFADYSADFSLGDRGANYLLNVDDLFIFGRNIETEEMNKFKNYYSIV